MCAYCQKSITNAFGCAILHMNAVYMDVFT
jgi:hypothetical protein